MKRPDLSDRETRVHLGTFGSICRDFEAALAKRAEEVEDVVLFTSLWSYPGILSGRSQPIRRENISVCIPLI